MRNRTRTLIRIGAATAALAMVPVESYVTGTPATQQAAADSVVPDSWRGPTAYLTAAYGLSDQQAVKRLEMQEDALQLNRKLRTTQQGTYAGMKLDMAKGVVHVRSTQPDKARAAAGRLAFGTVRFDKVAKPEKPVAEASATKVKAPDAAPAPSQDRCNPLNCASPLRSGVRLDGERDRGEGHYPFGGCTLGFTVHKKGSDRKYLLTAGHCYYSYGDDGTHNAKKERAWHNGLEVGEEGTSDGSYGHSSQADHNSNDPHNLWDSNTWTTPDYAMIPVQNESFWFGDSAQRTPGLLTAYGDCKDKTDDGYDCRLNSTLEITGTDSQPPEGTAVCQQGTAEAGSKGTHAPNGWKPGQRCGEVLDTGELVVTNICTAFGDSGGPLYISGKNNTATAVGILSDGAQAKDGYEKCDTVTHGEGPAGTWGKVASWYWSIGYILGHEKYDYDNEFLLYTR
ncbi:hypothetical protein ACFWZ2_13595 [Streptomyces sp. NPDC059002]|uniref:hypothetical protein n=1 Tax=Streptomyces sp. NPDC059002 TaxID=3346690 RepID=UPI003680E52B